jgi:hypothetical protein
MSVIWLSGGRDSVSQAGSPLQVVAIGEKGNSQVPGCIF